MEVNRMTSEDKIKYFALRTPLIIMGIFCDLPPVVVPLSSPSTNIITGPFNGGVSVLDVDAWRSDRKSLF